MRIIHLATTLNGGAGIAARRLVQAQIRVGANANIMSRGIHSGSTQLPLEVVNYAYTKKIESSVNTMFQSKIIQKDSRLVTPISIQISKDMFEKLHDADVLHVHSYYNFLSINSFRTLDSLKIPIFLTLHDQRVFTGGCHYSDGCVQYQTTCNSCPQVKPFFRKLVEKSQERQSKTFSSLNNLHVISPSRWLASIAESSQILNGRKVHVLPNALPEEFSMLATKNSPRKYKFAFIAENLWNPFKNFSLFVDALKNENVKANLGDEKVLIIGKGDLSRVELGITIEHVSTNSAAQMADYLQHVETVVVPSSQDNSPSVVLEALAAGARVVGSNAGGIPELIQSSPHIIFESGSLNSLVEALSRKVIEINHGEISKMGYAKYSLEEIGSSSIKLYQKFLQFKE